MPRPPDDGRPFSDDRYEHALDAFAFYYGRECQAVDLARLMETDTRLATPDHVVGRKVAADKSLFGRSIIFRITGVICEGCSIVDTSEGEPDWGLQKPRPYRQVDKAS
jgi:hypothetical protein